MPRLLRVELSIVVHLREGLQERLQGPNHEGLRDQLAVEDLRQDLNVPPWPETASKRLESG